MFKMPPSLALLQKYLCVLRVVILGRDIWYCECSAEIGKYYANLKKFNIVVMFKMPSSLMLLQKYLCVYRVVLSGRYIRYSESAKIGKY
jgi:hypothetical protein